MKRTVVNARVLSAGEVTGVKGRNPSGDFGNQYLTPLTQGAMTTFPATPLGLL